MASQPHRSRVGQGVHSDGNKSKAFSSGTQLSGNNNNNPIPPRIGTVEEPPSPTVDDINLDPNTSTPFICEPQQSIAEMERDRERVLTTAFKERFIPTMFLLSRAMHYAWFRGPNATRSGIFAIIFCIALIFTWYSVLIVPVVFIAVSMPGFISIYHFANAYVVPPLCSGPRTPPYPAQPSCPRRRIHPRCPWCLPVHLRFWRSY